MPDRSAGKPVYEAPAAVLVGGLGASGMRGSGLFTGGDTGNHDMSADWGQSTDDTRAKCVPGFGANTGCSPGTGVTGVSL
jgi:hypothetical protein